MEYDEEEDLI